MSVKICVFSDSHGESDAMLRAIASESPDLCFYLGDGWADLAPVQRTFPDLTFHAVRGNCDLFSPLPLSLRCQVDGVTIFAVNRDLAEPAELTCDLRSFGAFSGAAHSVLHHDDVKAVNTELNPDNVKPVSVPVDLKDGKVILPAASWNVIHLTK